MYNIIFILVILLLTIFIIFMGKVFQNDLQHVIYAPMYW